MNTEHSGKIYSIELNFDLGYVYAELLDYSDVEESYGILAQVYKCNILNKPKNIDDIDEIKSAGVLFGPVPINNYPKTKGKYAWKYIGKTTDYSKDIPFFKYLRGLLNEDDNWNNLNPWFKINAFDTDSDYIECDYKEVRRLETLILNHPEMVKIKVTMLYLIDKGENVGNFYDLTKTGNRNMYIQLINTYFDNDKVEELVKSLKPLE